MEAEGHSLNTVGYNCLISVMCRGGNVNCAFEMLAKCVLRAVNPASATFATLIYRLCSEDRIDESLGLSRDMLSGGVIANTMTYKLQHIGHPSLEERRDQRGPLDKITFNALIKALCEAGAIDRAMGLFDDMAERGVRGGVNVAFNLLVNGLCRAEKVENGSTQSDDTS